MPRQIETLAFLLLLPACSLTDAQPATPQRPTLSSDAATTAPGTLEQELGVDVDPDGTVIVPSNTKYGAGESTEVFASWLPWQHLDDASGTEEGTGDVALGVRHRFAEHRGANPALAFQAAVKLPVADERRGLSSGETDVLLAGMATWPGSDLSANLYYELGLLGDPDGAGLELAHLPAAVGGLSLGSGFGLFSEVAGSWIPERDVEAGFWTLGTAWSPSPQIVFDAGARAGVGDAPDVVIFVGFTWNLGRPSLASWER